MDDTRGVVNRKGRNPNLFFKLDGGKCARLPSFSRILHTIPIVMVINSVDILLYLVNLILK